MNADTIFAAFHTVEAVWSEIDRLSDAVIDAFAPDLTITYDQIETDVVSPNSRYGYHYQVAGVAPRQRSPGQLLLAFDLARPEAQSAWAMSHTALLTVAYAPNYADGWTLPNVLLGMDGRPAPAIAAACSSYFDGRLLWWNDTAQSWARSSWLFSVPLLAIDGPTAARREIVAPVLTLLRATDDSIEPFAGTAAVTFAIAHGTADEV